MANGMRRGRPPKVVQTADGRYLVVVGHVTYSFTIVNGEVQPGGNMTTGNAEDRAYAKAVVLKKIGK